MDVEALRGGFEEAQKTYGKDRFSREDCMDMAARAWTPALRMAWCQVFGLGEEDTAAVIQEPYPAKSAIGQVLEQAQRRDLTMEELEALRTEAGSSPYRNVGFSDAEYDVLAEQVLMLWTHSVPKRLGRVALSVLQGGGDPDSWASFTKRQIRPWVKRATPVQPGNFPALDRMKAALRWWENIFDSVYHNDRLNGSVPEFGGASLQWLSAPVFSKDHTKVWHTLRLERVLTGFYSVSKADKEALDRAPSESVV